MTRRIILVADIKNSRNGLPASFFKLVAMPITAAKNIKPERSQVIMYNELRVYIGILGMANHYR